jgi:virginiamycin B lyase
MPTRARCLAAAAFFLPLQAAAQSSPSASELVEANCSACHATTLIERSSGYYEPGWRALILTMIDPGPEALDAIAAHLAEAHPPNDRRAPTLVEGDLDLAIEAWSGPTLGQRARDPVEAPDGSIWWTGQWADVVTRLDPETGEMKEFLLPSGARAHTVLADAEGRIWYTGNRNATVGMIDPATGEITEYPMPDPAARDPHSAIFGEDGRLFFSLQGSNMAGRLDPATGEIDLVTMPVANARPYGTKRAPDGTIWISANGSNHLFAIDPDTMEVTPHEISDSGTTIRRLDFAADGTIWFVNSGLGRLGHYDPTTGDLREWESPSGPDSHPYAIAVIDDAVWYNESGKRPDALVRFDPEAETFQSWVIPSGEIGSGIVRHMRRTADGALLIHQSATNTVMRVTARLKD